MKRDWAEAHNKVAREGQCRICGQLGGAPDPAHIVPRSRVPGPEAMDERNIVPLCRTHHRDYDEARLDLLPYLRLDEQAFAAGLVGLWEALERTTNRRWGV